MQKCRDQRKDVIACFIDYEKAFDKVKHADLIRMLQERNIDDKDINVIKNLYWNQEAIIKSETSTSKSIPIQRGVRQGCVLSPMLFNLYSDLVFKEALHDVDMGVKVNGICCWYKLGLNMNVNKTKFMVFSREEHMGVHLTLNGANVERVRKFKYLGSSL